MSVDTGQLHKVSNTVLVLGRGVQMHELFVRTVGGQPGVAMARVLPEDVMIAFELEGEGGGVWTLRRDERGVEVIPEDVGLVDCRLRCSVDDFRSLLTGDLDGLSVFMSGRLRIEGDVGLAMRLEGAMRPATAA